MPLNAIQHLFWNFYKSGGLILKETMEDAGKALLRIVPVEAEGVIANSWVKK
jgi:hypothetical protein